MHMCIVYMCILRTYLDCKGILVYTLLYRYDPPETHVQESQLRPATGQFRRTAIYEVLALD